MNLAYFRKSTNDFNKTLETLKKEVAGEGLEILGETDLPNKAGKIVHVCNPDWLGNLIASDYNLIGLLPCSIAVLQKGEDVLVGVGSPSVLGGVSQHPAVAELAAHMDSKFKEIINKSAGVSDLKPSNIKLYSTTTCPYCNMEKAWLESNKIKHQVVYVDLNQQEAEAMVKKTGQMGVPVTEIEYEDGDPEYIVGFDKARLSDILSVKA